MCACACACVCACARVCLALGHDSCVHVHVCVCARARVCVCVCARACLALGHILLALPLVGHGALLDQLHLELEAAALHGALDRCMHLRYVIANVLLTRTLKGHLCAHDTDEDADLVLVLPDLVCAPVDAPLAHLRRHVASPFEEQRDPVREAVHADPGLGVWAAEADASLDNHRVPLDSARRVLVGCDELRAELLEDAQPHVVLADGAQARRGRRREVRL